MSGPDLLSARAAFVSLARQSVSLCRRLALDWSEIEAHAGGVFMAPVHLQGSWFSFDPDGIEATVVEVRGPDAVTVLDLLAWVPAVPDRWFVAVGGAPALGMACAANAATYATRLPLQLHRTPQEWLMDRCFGAVLLDIDAGVEWLVDLPLADTIAVRDDAHARQVDMARRRLGLSRHQRLVVPAANTREAA